VAFLAIATIPYQTYPFQQAISLVFVSPFIRCFSPACFVVVCGLVAGQIAGVRNPLGGKANL
jgi:hypothetical protein